MSNVGASKLSVFIDKLFFLLAIITILYALRDVSSIATSLRSIANQLSK